MARHLRVKVFRGAQNLPLLFAVELGFFERYAIDFELLFTANSVELREGLAAGDFQLAHTAADNAMAMKDVAGIDVVILMGGDSGLNELFVQPDVSALGDLQGRILIVDAPDTAYALQAREILRRAGLRAGIDYRIVPVGGTFQRIKALQENRLFSASMLNPPFSEQARQAGLLSLGRAVDLLGPYQATVAFGLRRWVESHAQLVVDYMLAYMLGLRYALDPANRAEAVDMLSRKLSLPDATAASTYDLLAESNFGLDADARLNLAGLQNVLRIRIEHEGVKQAHADQIANYFDLNYYQQAVQKLNAC